MMMNIPFLHYIAICIIFLNFVFTYYIIHVKEYVSSSRTIRIYIYVTKKSRYVLLSGILLITTVASMRWGRRSWPYPFDPRKPDFPWSSDEPKFCFGYILPMIDFCIRYITLEGLNPFDTVRCNPMSNNDYITVETAIYWRA